MKYGVVSGQDLSGKAKESLPFREVCKICQQLASDPMVLAVVPHHQGHICGKHIAVNAILANSADGLHAVLLSDRHQDHLLEVVHGSELLKLLMGNIPPGGDEPLVHAL